VIASSGQASTQTPQSTHSSTSIVALSEAMLIASLGHSSTQVSQPVHFSLSTLAGIYATLSKNLKTYYCSVTTEVLQKSCYQIEYGMLQNYDDFTTYF
jgi:hypothetical protein